MRIGMLASLAVLGVLMVPGGLIVTGKRCAVLLPGNCADHSPEKPLSACCCCCRRRTTVMSDEQRNASRPKHGATIQLARTIAIKHINNHNFGRLPRVWVDGKSGEAEKLRDALGSEASNFMTKGLVNRLPEAKKAKARLVLTYWMDEAALSASLGPPSSSSEPRPSRPSAVSSLSKLFVSTSAQSLS